MKSEESHQEVADLLRSRAPEVAAPPGLEGRILRAIGEERHRPQAIHWWKWLMLPPAVAMLMVIVSPEKKDSAKPVAENLKPVVPPVETPKEKETATASLDTMNPLAKETEALKRDAERAGKFLINCLPSVNSMTEK